jgi:prepilin signal peptidase PulO-like enzyme (type II secretory pathway)
VNAALVRRRTVDASPGWSPLGPVRILITVTQATVTLARGGNRHTTFPYGPAIAAAFVLAAVV